MPILLFLALLYTAARSFDEWIMYKDCKRQQQARKHKRQARLKSKPF
ncbi:MAG TPA: hypothetical protein PKA46_09105 [Ferruginibacter sp.]|nr:hypothetical protein [Ferruginibacter sp.]